MLNEAINIFNLKSLPAFSFDYKMRFKEYDLNKTVEDLRKVFPQCVADNIEVKTILTGKELKVMADLMRIREAFLNLIRNASDAMPSGGSLTLSTKEVYFRDALSGTSIRKETAQGVCALLSVSDTGIGMDESTKERMYEPFFTTKGDKERGLGFPIAFSIIQNHRGTIMVESAPDVGTTVNIYLPLLKKESLRVSPIALPSSFVGGDYYEKYGYMNKPLKSEIFL